MYLQASFKTMKQKSIPSWNTFSDEGQLTTEKLTQRLQQKARMIQRKSRDPREPGDQFYLLELHDYDIITACSFILW